MADALLGSVLSRLSAAVTGHVYAHGLGETFASGTGFLTATRPDSVLCAAFAFVAAVRLPAPPPDGFLALAPDLAVERRLAEDTSAEMTEKVVRWLNAGARLVWAVDPRARTVTTHRADRPPQALGVGDTLDGEDVLPDLAVPVALLFPPPRHWNGSRTKSEQTGDYAPCQTS